MSIFSDFWLNTVLMSWRPAALLSLKIYFLLYGVYLILINVPVTNIPMAILFIVSLIVVLFKETISPANFDNVDVFFQQQIDLPLKKSDGLLMSNRCLSVPLVTIGHRGACHDAPESSLAAIKLCKQRGCTAIEFDVAITKDLVPVVFHDNNLLRLTGIKRDISDISWEQLSGYDISLLHPKGYLYRNERVATLDEVIDLCLQLKVKFFIDLKDNNKHIVDAVVKQFKKAGMYSMGVVSSFYAKAIYDVRSQDPEIIGCMAHRPGYFRYRRWNPELKDLEHYHKSVIRDVGAGLCDLVNDWALDNFYWWFLGLSAIVFNKDSISKERAHRWMGNGIKVFVAVVNTEEEKKHFVNNYQVGYMTDTLETEDTNLLSTLIYREIVNKPQFE